MLKVSGKKLAKVYLKDQYYGPWFLTFSWMISFILWKKWKLFNYADDNSVSVNSKELNIVSQLLQSEAEFIVRWFCSNAMEANPSKFQGILFKGNKLRQWF